MIDHGQLREYIIQPVLRGLDLYSPAAEELLILTAAHESRLGQYLHQVGGGPAVGIYQMEPATHYDIWENYLRYKSDLAQDVVDMGIRELHGARGRVPDSRQMAGNLYYATAMARIHYLRVPAALPAANDVHGLAEYWKQYYNTPLGAGTVAQAMAHYQDLVA